MNTDWNANERAAYEVGVRDGLLKASFAAKGTAIALRAATKDETLAAVADGLANAFESEARGS